MPINPVYAAPCWMATLPPEGDELHFATRSGAIAAAVKLPAGAVVRRLPVRCYVAACDRCGFCEGDSESDGGFHFPACDPGQVLPGLCDLETVAGELLCLECRGVDPLTMLGIPSQLAALVALELAR